MQPNHVLIDDKMTGALRAGRTLLVTTVLITTVLISAHKGAVAGSV